MILIDIATCQNSIKYSSWQELGLVDAADVLSSSLPWEVDNYSVSNTNYLEQRKFYDDAIPTKVCDNVDLKIILEEYSSYHQVKYGKRPDICRRAEKEVGTEGCLQGNPARRRKAQRALNKMKRWPISYFWFPILNLKTGWVFLVGWLPGLRAWTTTANQWQRATEDFRSFSPIGKKSLYCNHHYHPLC